MTKSKSLIDQHFKVYLDSDDPMGSSCKEHTKVSIEYAISVLEELRHMRPIYFEEMENSMEPAIPLENIFNKIQELKTLIHETKTH